MCATLWYLILMRRQFINLASGSSLPVGHGFASCTTRVEATDPFQMDGHDITLIDTPGFDDPGRSDAEILREVARYLDLT